MRTTARVFCDPPMNFVPLRKDGHRVSLGADVAAPADGALAGLADGTYVAGFRANHLTLKPPFRRRRSLSAARVAVTEITGSETFLHLTHGGDRWVGLVHGVHDLDRGTEVDVWLDPAHVYLFDQGGALVAAAPYAMAA